MDRTPVFGSKSAAVLESMRIGIACFDRDWRFTYINPVGEELISRQAGGLLGRCVWREFRKLDGSSLQRQMLQSAAEGEPLRRDIYWRRRRMWAEVRGCRQS